MLPIPKEYYLDSLNELEIAGQLFRTGGSGQTQVWVEKVNEKPKGKYITFRQYFKGQYKGNKFFAKQFLDPNLDWPGYPGNGGVNPAANRAKRPELHLVIHFHSGGDALNPGV